MRQQPSAQWWREQLDAYSLERGFRFNRLVEIHSRFSPTGLLTTEYLRFLWRNVVKDVDELVFGRLVEMMALHNAMFPCDDCAVGGGAGVAEASLAKLQEAVSRGIRMQFVIEIRADYVPPAIIAQFLGAFGRSRVEIFRNLVFHTSWSRGVSFEAAGRECLISRGENLVSPGRARASTEPRCFIEINIGGTGKSDVSAVGFEIKEKVVQLLEEKYPGLLFDASMNPTYMTGPDAWQDSLAALERDLLEKLDQNLEIVLNQILAAVGAQNLGTDEALAKQLSTLKSDMQRDVSLKLDSNVEKIVVSVEAIVQKALSTATERRILRGVAQDVAFLRWPIPRLVCVLPAPEKGREPLTEIDRSFEKWSALLDGWVRSGKKGGRRCATRELRVFFLCPQDMSLAECGRGGQGYEVKELLSWAKKTIPSAKVGLALEAFCSGIEKMASVSGEGLEGARPAGGPRPQQVRPAPLQGYAYDQLKDMCRSFEVDGTVKGKSPFPSFDTAMQLVDRGGRGVEWAWVRTHNIDQFVSS
ncbi:LRR-GTPase of the ROCO family, putative pseudogene [Ectocarpus siliculosus]|nr:LRR-GTPase of the ROCO family, putative pseudogene [Ectocarpus siliculosus]|eukprot:CBJ48972.1 LRR-GTPase of the ROCO family, putative pseudogene [Ectocarpus siliculosus]